MSDTSSVPGVNALIAGPNVRFLRPEIQSELSKWKLVRDCLAGEKAVKGAKDEYLPRPNAGDSSKDNLDRYDSYLQRAVFYNATRRTLDGLVGQVFIRPPVIELPKGMEYLLTDADGAGVGIEEQAKKVLTDDVSFGRLGMLVDYPAKADDVTKLEEEELYYRPTILVYQPEDVINWRTIQVGARRLISLVVLQELWLSADDGFQATYDLQWRVLKLAPVPQVSEGDRLPVSDYQYEVEIWRSIATGAKSGPSSIMTKVDSFIPQDANGKPLREIPFLFVGAINNDTTVDPSPLYDLAVLNIAHYRNSADYEESCFLVGQPTVYASGLTESWVKDVMGGAVAIGSRAIIPLPVGGAAGLLQVDPNSLPKEAMDQKEKQMVALGARLVEQRNVQQTLGEAQQKEAAQTSILASVAKNVSAAYTRCLQWCALFAGVSGVDVKFELNTDFIAAQMTPDERAQLVAEWQAGGISYTEMRSRLRKAGIATQKDEEARKEAQDDKLREDPTKLAVAGMKSQPGDGVDPNKGRTSPLQNSKTQA